MFFGSGIIDAALYIAGFLAVIGMTAYTFGRRKKEFKTEDLLPFVVFFAVFITAYNLCLLWPDFIAMGSDCATMRSFPPPSTRR